MHETKLIEFTKVYGAYQIGAKAVFIKDHADKLLALGMAKPVDPPKISIQATIRDAVRKIVKK